MHSVALQTVVVCQMLGDASPQGVVPARQTHLLAWPGVAPGAAVTWCHLAAASLLQTAAAARVASLQAVKLPAPKQSSLLLACI